MISLPSGVFKPYAGVSTAIIIFAKGGKTENVFFYDVQSDGFTLDDKRTQIGDGKGDLPDVLAKYQQWCEGSPTTSHRLIASGEWIVFRDERFLPGYLKHLLTADGFHRQFMQTVSSVGGSLLRARPSEVAKIRVTDQADEPIEEVAFLRSLLLWLAWDLGEQLTDQIGPLVEDADATRAVRANAVLYELLPAAAADPQETAELERSIRMTVVPTGTEGARAANWMRRHLAVGLAVRDMSAEALRIKPGLARGMLAMVPKSSPARLRVVSAVAGPEVTLWDFDGPRTFLLQ